MSHPTMVIGVDEPVTMSASCLDCTWTYEAGDLPEWIDDHAQHHPGHIIRATMTTTHLVVAPRTLTAMRSVEALTTCGGGCPV